MPRGGSWAVLVAFLALEVRAVHRPSHRLVSPGPPRQPVVHVSGRRAAAALLAAAALPAALPAVGDPVPPPAEDESVQTLRWSDALIDQAVFEAVDNTYNVAFVTYLARFLLNFDASSRAWWRSQGLPSMPGTRVDDDTRDMRMRTFSQFAASVQYGLRTFSGPAGVDQLFDSLIRTHGAYPERRRHLALAFALLEASQPREKIAGLLRAGDGTPVVPPYGTAPFSPALPDYLALDPLFLLPPTQVPVWDVNVRRYVVRGLDEVRFYGSYAQGGYEGVGPDGQELSVFGPRAAFAVQRERALTAQDYALFALSGAAGCCVTHTAVTPLDVVKTRLQTDPGRYPGLLSGARQVWEEEGWRNLFLGVGATVAGYAWYGMTVYPGYEFFSRFYDRLAGPASAEHLHTPIVLLSGACATIIACLGVCPAEAARIRIVAQPSFANSFVGTIQRIAAEDGLASLYDGIWPLILRQVVFGMMKFYTFDAATASIFASFPALKAQVWTQLTVSLTAGLAAGVASACISQPADTILSEVNRQAGRPSISDAVINLWRSGGPARFFTGIGSRCVWSGSIISGQFFLYDIAKTIFAIDANDLLLFLDIQFKDLQL